MLVQALLQGRNAYGCDRAPGWRLPAGDSTPLALATKEGRWDELGSYIDQTFLEAFATIGKPEEIAGKLRQKYGKDADRLAIYAPYGAPDAMWASIIAQLKAG